MNIIKEYDREFRQFLLMTHRGFVRGSKTHGEHSNKRMSLIREIKHELRDVAAYAFFQFKKLNQLEEKLHAISNHNTNIRT